MLTHSLSERVVSSSNMKTLLFFFCVAYVNADLGQILNSSVVHLGPHEVSVKIGNLSKRYTPLSNDDLKASRNARNLIEEARRMFAVGFHTLPPLDPYFNPNIPLLEIHNDMVPVSGKIHAQNCKMTGAKRFKLNLLELRLKSGRVDFGLTLPRLDLNVDIESELLFADILPLNLRGNLSVTLRGLSVLGAVQAERTEFGKTLIYQLVALHYRVHTDDVAIQFKGTQFDINEMLRESPAEISGSISDLVDKLKEEINNYVAKIVLHEANNILTGATVTQVTAYLLPEKIAESNKD